MLNIPTDSELQLPLIHLNGNSGAALGKQYFTALQALEALENDFANIEFHSRDYYPMGDEAFLKAKAQRVAIKLKFSEIREYLERHSEHCFASAR